MRQKRLVDHCTKEPSDFSFVLSFFTAVGLKNFSIQNYGNFQVLFPCVYKAEDTLHYKAYQPLELTSHMYEVSVLGVTSIGFKSLPSYGPIHAPVGMSLLAQIPYPVPGIPDKHS